MNLFLYALKTEWKLFSSHNNKWMHDKSIKCINYNHYKAGFKTYISNKKYCLLFNYRVKKSHGEKKELKCTFQQIR